MENLNIIDNKTLIEVLAKKGFGLQGFTTENNIIENIRVLRPMDCGKNLIRIGSDGDGGYVIPDDLLGVTHCFSPGVSNISDFEQSLFELYGIKSFLADYSVEKPPESLQAGDFEKKFIASRQGEMFMTLEEWMNRKLTETTAGDLILQMDIEGGEYDAIISTSSEYLKMFRIIVVELHMLEEMIFDKLDCFGSIFRKLTEDNKVVHLHPNNCCGSFAINGIEIPRVMEATLIRNDRITEFNTRNDFPHPLDRKNVPHNPELNLPAIWYTET